MRTRITVAVATAAALLGAAAATTSAGAATAAAAGFDFDRPEVVASGLEVPWGLAFLPDGSALVAERGRARIMQVRPGTAPVVAAQVPGAVPAGEGGLLGLAVSPTFATDNLVYAYLTAASDNRIVRFRLNDPGTVQLQPVLTGIPKANVHNGGRLAFGPDGNLYAGTGDAGQSALAQNPASLGGKILRIRPDGGVPAGNPFQTPVYSLGHRNVQGLAWDAGQRLYATEFGQNRLDEVNVIVAGGNYGWPIVEGRGTDPRFVDPIVQWSTAEASPSGAAVAGDTLFVAALRGARLWLVPLTGGSPAAELTGRYGRLRGRRRPGRLAVGGHQQPRRPGQPRRGRRPGAALPAGGRQPGPEPARHRLRPVRRHRGSGEGRQRLGVRRQRRQVVLGRHHPVPPGGPRLGGARHRGDDPARPGGR